jgi:hypothetical protein
MVRLRNTKTDAVVSVRDEKAELLGAEWVPVEAKKTPAKKAASSKTENTK